MQLRPWQIKSAFHLADILNQGKNCVDMSDGGTGKTYTGCAVADILRKNTLAIVPKISISNWYEVASGFTRPRMFEAAGYEAARTGRTRLGTWENPAPANLPKRYTCQCCLNSFSPDEVEPGTYANLCPHHPAGLHCVTSKSVPWDYGKFTWASDIEFLIIDEVHRCSALDSLNADMLIAAKRQGIPTLGMSATAACTPLQMRALGYLLGLHGLDWEAVKMPKPLTIAEWPQVCAETVTLERIPNWKTWAYRQGCRFDPQFHGMIWQQPEERKQKIMRDIRSDIIPGCGVRVTTAEIPDFPKRIITAETYDIDKPGQVDALYAEMAESIAVLEAESGDDVTPDHPLTALLRARQKLELLKVPIAVELAQDEMAKGRSVAIFVNFKQTLEELAKKLKTDCLIHGGQHESDRNNSIAHFQTNLSPVIIANIAAGGVSVSLHDLDGEHPRIGLVMPNHSAVQMLQVFFRLAREGGKSTAIYKIILAAGTIEKKIQKAFESKRDCIDSLNDGDLNPLTNSAT